MKSNHFAIFAYEFNCKYSYKNFYISLLKLNKLLIVTNYKYKK